MPITLRSIRTLAAVSTAVLAVLALAFHLSSTQASHDPGAMAAMAIDMDPGASPANTATSLGAREFCARIDQNGALDADEDSVDAVQFDVTAEGIPAETAMLSFNFRIAYDEAALSVTEKNAEYLLAATSGSSLLDVSDSVPDNDENNTWMSAVIDVGTAESEKGSGVLERITIQADSGAPPGIQWIDLEDGQSAHTDGNNDAHAPEVLHDGFVAIGQDCPQTEPSPTPRPPTTPSPTPGLIPGTIRGTVRDVSGVPIPFAAVSLYRPDCLNPCWSGETDVNGQYVLFNLPPSDYVLMASASGFASEYWTASGGSSDRATAETLVLAPDAWAQGIDFSLSTLPLIQGKVVDSHGDAIGGASVHASPVLGGWGSTTASDEAGYYSLQVSGAGDYLLTFSASGFIDSELAPLSVDLGQILAGIDVTMARKPAIKGRVTDSQGNPIANAYVSAQRRECCWGASAISDEQGYYALFGPGDPMTPGTYTVSAWAWGYFEEYWTSTGGTRNGWEAEPVLLPDQPEAVVGGIDFTLTRGGIMRGTVRDRAGNPLEGISVEAHQPWRYCPCAAETGADGTYEIVALDSGDYEVTAWGEGFLPKYWTSTGGADDPALREAVPVQEEQVTSGVDFVMDTLARIRGRVTDSSGSPIAGAEVSLREAPGGYWCRACTEDSTDADGEFEVFAPPGDYLLHVASRSYLPEFWTANGGTEDPSEAAVFTLQYGSVVQANFQLARLGMIQGSVLDNHGEPLGLDLYVIARGPLWTGEPVLGGSYLIDELYDGDYMLSIYYRGRMVYWNALGGTFDENAAELVHVETEQTVTGINFELIRLSTISGTVTDRSGNPIPWANVGAEDVNGTIFRSTQAQADGSYILRNLHEGIYKVWAQDDEYDTVYWTSTTGTLNPEEAEGIPVQYDSTVEGINFTLPRRGEITGTIRDSNGNPMAGVYVYAEPLLWCCGSGAYTEPDGSFRIPRVAAGDYKVTARKDGYWTRYWTESGGTYIWEEVDPVHVTSEHTSAGIDLQMFRPSTLSGRVTDSAGEPIPFIWLYLLSNTTDGCCYGHASTGADGRYEMSVPAGDFFVGAEYWLTSVYWTRAGGTPSRQSAEPVAIPVEGAVVGIDIVLKRPGSLSGTVRDNAGNPIAYASVTASGPSCPRYCDPWVDWQGQFNIPYLYPGEYTVKAEHPDYQAEFWTEDGGDPEEGDTVVVAEDGTASGLDFSLNRLGSISGTVTGPDGAAVAGASITYDSEYCDRCNGPTTDTQGNFKIDRIPPGGYVLKVTAPGMTAEYWTPVSGTSDEDRAQEIALGDGQNLDGINFRLLPAACAPADITGDTRVNVRDLTAVARAMGSRPGQRRWNPDADVNDDGRVNHRDLALVLRAFHSRECR